MTGEPGGTASVYIYIYIYIYLSESPRSLAVACKMNSFCRLKDRQERKGLFVRKGAEATVIRDASF